ncbi:MAG: TAT-variant-translocated molybdopterin oxidoreductase [bacterium]
MKNNGEGASLDLAQLRARLQESRGPQYWRCLEELADTEAFRTLLHDEFPQHEHAWENTLDRRDFLRLMSASLALAGLSACTKQPQEKIFPYVRQPENVVPGQPLYFASAVCRSGYANGVLVESHMGRPTKIEGNPQHPASRGTTDVFGQAEMLTLYDPDRSQVVTHLGSISTWETFISAITTELEGQRLKNGAGLRLLTETITSPTLAAQLRALQRAFPAAKWHQYEPVNRDAARAGAQMAMGEFVETHYRLSQAEVILALDGDFLTDMPGSLIYAREFADRRRVADHAKMNRVYVVESSPGLAGTMADHRLALRASDIEPFALLLAAELGVVEDGRSKIEAPDPRSSILELHSKWLKALAADLKKHRGAGAIIPGEQQTPLVHALAHAMNQALGNTGRTVIYTDAVEARPVLQNESLRALVADMDAGKVDLLLMLGGNPVFDAPADLSFAQMLDKVKVRVHLGLYHNETSALCHWHIPELHVLESWSDARAFDGAACIIQPLITPLYGGKSAHDLLAVCTGQAGQSTHDLVRNYWKAESLLRRAELSHETILSTLREYEKNQNLATDFENFWQTSLHDGVIAGTALPVKTVDGGSSMVDRILQSFIHYPPSTIHDSPSLEIIFRPDPTIGDGRYANNGWLQELPKPLSKLTWDNAAQVSPALAEKLALSNKDVVELKFDGRSIQIPIWIVPGQPKESITVHFGYGRNRAGKVGSGVGVNAYALRTSRAFWHGAGVEIRKTGEHYILATTQMHNSMENRHLVRAGTLRQYQEHPEFVHEMGHEPPRTLTLYPEHKYEGYAWGMSIDLNACIGCNACTIACQAENNIAVVGKDQVENGREMHWIRVDRYYEGDLDDPAVYHQPVPCMHCENAPCEPVCPVGATVHGDEGLNEMVYNRCVGTRYCANNCPYKVRRFNFLLYSDFETPSLKMLRNPDVTVRSRGVMEKCTYCVQRINSARIEAKKEDRQIRDGEIITACQQVCPTQAIAFGDINDPNSRVSKLKAQKLNYGLLTDLNTRPRTTYLARLRNPNPELETSEEHA